MNNRIAPGIILGIFTSSVAHAEPWVEDKAFFTETHQSGSSMVDAADLDGDGWIDLVFANGGGYNKGSLDNDLKQQAFHNEAGAAMTPIESPDIFGGVTYTGRAVKIRDIDNDGDNDIFLGVTWQGQSQLFVNDGAGNFVNETAINLPAINASVGDLEFGDIDDDGDLDVMLADWGPDSPVDDPINPGGVTRLWLQDGAPGHFGPGTAMFSDFTVDQMPDIGIRWSWDLEFVDLDNDYDLDAVVSCFACTGSSVHLFANDSAGTFTAVPLANAPQGAGALSVEAIDLDGDAFLDLVTTHDAAGGRNRVLLSDGLGAFSDASLVHWPASENPASYDHMAAFLDHDSDGRPDIVLGALQPGLNKYPDRLMVNQNGKFTANNAAFAEIKASSGTYAIVLADFNRDHRLDVAMAQNENAFDKKVFLASDVERTPDTLAPRFINHEALPADLEFGQDHTLRLRCHDNKSPLMLHDFQRGVDDMPDGRPFVESWNTTPADPDTTPPDETSAPGQWYGEYLWRVRFSVPKQAALFAYRICAIDAAGNKGCTELASVTNQDAGTTGDLDTTTGTAGSSSSTSDTGSTSSAGTTTTDPAPTGTTPTGTTGPSDTPTTGGQDDGSAPMTTTAASSSSSDTAPHDPGTDGGCSCNGRPGPRSGLFALLLVLCTRRRRA
ncbi:MAG TPA: VCBS repeat-containing protein [Nannocystis sp.]|jgi:hypothetical protein